MTLLQKAKHDFMRTTNTLSVLECIMQAGPVTKKDIQDRTGLSWGAVSNIISVLLQKKVISEAKSTESNIGRTPSKFDISRNNNLIIGIDINAAGLTTVLTDFKCNVLKSMRYGVIEKDKEGIIKQIKDIIRSTMEDARIDRQKASGIGVAMQGAVDTERGVSVFSPYFPDWKEVHINEILQEEFKLPVLLDHDPNCMALAERWLGAAKGVKNLLLVRLSMGGIGMSIIINEKIYRGADGSAGELGHIIVDPDGPRCTCGNYGCLEVYASGRSLLMKAKEAIKQGLVFFSPDIDEHSEVPLEAIAEAATGGNGHVRNLFDEMAFYLGIGISNAINVFNPQLIIIGGELARYEKLFMAKLKETVESKAWKWSNKNIIASRLGSNSPAIGAAALFIQKVFAGETSYILR